MVVEDILNLGKLYTRMLEPVCETYRLTRLELDVLLFLANHPSYDTAADIVSRRALSKSHVSVTVRSLGEKGLLDRVYERGNRKTIHLRLRPGTEAMVADGREAQKRFFDSLFRGFSEHEREEIQESLRRLAGNVEYALLEGKERN